MRLVDTNAWVRHLRKVDAQLVRWLERDRVVTCEVILGELLLGSGIPAEVAEALARLPLLPSPSAPETLDFILRRRRVVQASGLGWADVQVLAAALAAGARLYSCDGALRGAWRALGGRAA